MAEGVRNASWSEEAELVEVRLEGEEGWRIGCVRVRIERVVGAFSWSRAEYGSMLPICVSSGEGVVVCSTLIIPSRDSRDGINNKTSFPIGPIDKRCAKTSVNLHSQ